MKFTPTNFLILLFVCCSQTVISMEETKKSESKMTLGLYRATIAGDICGAHAGCNFMGIDNFFKKHKDYPNFNNITYLEEELETTIKKTKMETALSPKKDTTTNTQQRCIIYNCSHKPDYFLHMLQTMLQRNNLEPKTVISQYCSRKPGINLSAHFIESLSLKAQETLCTYVVDMITNPHPAIADKFVITENECLDESLFIPFALQDIEHVAPCYKLLKEIVLLQLHPQPSEELFAKMYRIYKQYAEIKFLKKYPISENQ